MNSSNSVLRFAPDIYDNNETMLAIYNGQKSELNEYEAIIQRAFLNNFVKHCDVEGIRRFEAIFHIRADEINDSLEFRQARIINKFAQLPPYTEIFVKQLLANLFGEENYEFEVGNNENYIIENYTKVGSPTIVNGIASDFSSSKYIKSNMAVDCTRPFRIIVNEKRGNATKFNGFGLGRIGNIGYPLLFVQSSTGYITLGLYLNGTLTLRDYSFTHSNYSDIDYIISWDKSKYSLQIKNVLTNEIVLNQTLDSSVGLLRNSETSGLVVYGYNFNSGSVIQSTDLKRDKFYKGNALVYEAIAYNPYIISINIETDIEGLVADTIKDLKGMIPANMIIATLIYRPYVHAYLKKYYTHEEMKQFTHGELKNG